MDEHNTNLQLVFERIKESGLKLKMTKCCLLKEEVKFLGHRISAKGVQTDPEKNRKYKELANTVVGDRGTQFSRVSILLS